MCFKEHIILTDNTISYLVNTLLKNEKSTCILLKNVKVGSQNFGMISNKELPLYL